MGFSGSGDGLNGLKDDAILRPLGFSFRPDDMAGDLKLVLLRRMELPLDSSAPAESERADHAGARRRHVDQFRNRRDLSVKSHRFKQQVAGKAPGAALIVNHFLSAAPGGLKSQSRFFLKMKIEISAEQDAENDDARHPIEAGVEIIEQR